MKVVSMEVSLEDEVDSLEETLRSALQHLAEVASRTIGIEQAAWWLCANHRDFVSKLDRAMCEAVLANASAHGPPPKGKDWEEWIENWRRR